MKKWKCKVCNYTFKEEEPPEFCPICGAPKSEFVEVEEKKIGCAFSMPVLIVAIVVSCVCLL